MKKISLILLTVCLLLLCSCGESKTQAPTVNPDEPYATVNGETITVEEIEYFKKRDRSDIINEFSAEYNITDFATFWDTMYDGSTTPTDALQKRALEDAVSAKVKLVEMKKQGIYDDITFNGLQSRAEEYNESHKNQPATVGVNSIDLTSFYTYYLETGEMELKNRLEMEQDEFEKYLEDLISDAETQMISEKQN